MTNDNTSDSVEKVDKSVEKTGEDFQDLVIWNNVQDVEDLEDEEDSEIITEKEDREVPGIDITLVNGSFDGTMCSIIYLF